MQPVLLFDYGGVLAHDSCEPSLSALSRLLLTDTTMVRKALSESSPHGAAIRRDECTEAAFWARVCEYCGISRSRVAAPDAELTGLWAGTYKVSSAMRELARSLSRTCHIGVLTNVDRYRSPYLLAALGNDPKLDIYIPSYEVRAIKPAAAIWTAALQRIDSKLGPVDRTIFIDDRSQHVAAAVAHEMTGLLFQGITSLVQGLSEADIVIHADV